MDKKHCTFDHVVFQKGDIVKMCHNPSLGMAKFTLNDKVIGDVIKADVLK